MHALEQVVGGLLTALLLAGCAAGTQSSRAGVVVSPSGPSPSSNPHATAETGAALMVVRIVAASPRVAYVLAGSGPSGEDHPVLFRTSDRGAHFGQVTPPAARSRTGRPLPVRGLTFVDADHGYAVLGNPQVSRPSVMVDTSDGGKSWHRARLPGSAGSHVDSVAGNGRQVFAATIRCHGRLRCTTVAVYTSAVGANRWRDTGARLPARESSSGVGLAAWDSSVWLMLGVGSSRHPLTLRSVDSGRSFAATGTPYAVSCRATATSARVIWTACATGMLVAFQRTVDRTQPSSLPVSGAGTGGTFLDPLSDDLAYFGTAVGQHAGLYLTRDAGRTFTKVAGLPGRLTGSGGWSATTFLDTRIGLTPGKGLNLLRTTDGGRTWRTTRLGPS